MMSMSDYKVVSGPKKVVSCHWTGLLKNPIMCALFRNFLRIQSQNANCAAA